MRLVAMATLGIHHGDPPRLARAISCGTRDTAVIFGFHVLVGQFRQRQYCVGDRADQVRTSQRRLGALGVLYPSRELVSWRPDPSDVRMLAFRNATCWRCRRRGLFWGIQRH